MQIVILMGHLGKDPEVKYMNSGSAVCNTSLATSKKWTDKSSGEAREHTEWHRLVMYGRTAEVAGQYLHKGSKILIQGEIKTKKWQNKEGVDQYTTEIVVNQLKMLDGRQGGDAGTGNRSSNNGQAAPQQPRQAQPAQQSGGGFDGFDDDIPF